MGVQLKVAFDGTTPGLEEHRLSISAFAEPLKYLLLALQRTASAILASASEDPDYGSRGGKFADAAKLLDLELAAVDVGSASPTFVCTARPRGGAQPPLPHVDMSRYDLTEAAIERLIRDIDAERSGKLRSASARKYLRSLPEGVTSQRYIATSGDKVLVDIGFGTATIAEAPAPLPRLIKIIGSVVSVGFDPGQSFVAIKTGTKTVRCMATAEQVETAISLRAAPVALAVLDGEKPSVVWIKGSGKIHVPTLDETIEHLHSSWKRTLEVLAQ
jgi:hypothetical protein